MKMWTDRRMDRQTDKKRTNKRTELHQFRKETSYDGDLCRCHVCIRLDKLFSSYSPETKIWTTDGQTSGQNPTNEPTELYQFRKEPSYDGDLSPCQV